MSSSRLDSILPSWVQMAPSAAQSVVTGSTMVMVESESGVTFISHLTLPVGSSRRIPEISPPVTVKAWSTRVL